MALAFRSEDDSPLVRALLADLGVAPGTLDLAIDERDEMLGFLTAADEGDRERGSLELLGRHGHPSRPKTRTAFSRRNLGHTSSLNPTCGSSEKIRSSERPIGKYPAYMTLSAPRLFA